MNKPFALLAGLILSCTVSSNTFAGAFVDHDAAPKNATEQSQIEALNKRIEHLSLALNNNVTAATNGESFSETEDNLDTGLVHFDDEGGVLFESLPDTTFEVELLRHRAHYPEHSVVLGGYLKVAAQRWSGHVGTFNPSTPTTPKNLANGSGVYWLASMLDVYGAANEWISAYASFKATNAATEEDRTSQKVNISKAFVSVGNLDHNPLFLLIGKTHLPFGVFGGGGPLSPSVTRSTFKSDTTNQLWLGFDNKTFNSNLSLFQSATDKKISNFVLSFFFTQKPADKLEYTLGMGYMNDVRGTDSALGHALSDTRRLKSNRLALYNFNAALSYGPFAFHSEFIKSFRPVTVNTPITGFTTAGTTLGHPESWYFSGDYTALVLEKITIFSLGYSTAKHTEGVIQPISNNLGADLNSFYGVKQAWVASATREIGHNFYVALECQRSKSYANEGSNVFSLDLNYYF